MLDHSIVRRVQELHASRESYRRIASTVGISKNSVWRIVNRLHASQLPRKPRKSREASPRCPICGAVDSLSIDLHGDVKARYLAVRAEVERQIALGLRTPLSALNDGWRSTGKLT